MPTSPHPEPPEQPAGQQGLARRVGRALVLGVLVAALATAGVLYWQDRRLSFAERALERGAADEALRVITEYLIDHPGSTRARALLARSYMANGQPNNTVEIFNEIGPATVADLHAFGRALMMMARWSDAQLMLEQALQLQPANGDLLYEITICRIRQSQFDTALQSAERLSELPGNEARGALLSGTIHSDLGNFEQAVEAYSRVLQFRSNAEDLELRADQFFYQFGLALLEAGKPRQAVTEFEKSIELLPVASAYVELGNAFMELGEIQNAVAAWRDACDRDPIAQEARQALANVALQEGDPKQALRWLRPLADNPGLEAATAYALQRAHTMLENEEEAAEWQKRTAMLRNTEQVKDTIASILFDNPNSYWADIIRAHRFAAVGNWEEARAIMKPLVAESPADPFVAKLAQAIEDRDTLPPITDLPLKKY